MKAANLGSLSHPLNSFGELSPKQVAHSASYHEGCHVGIKWAQSHSTFNVLCRQGVVTSHIAYQRTHAICGRRIGVESDSTIQPGYCRREIRIEMSQGKGCLSQDGWVVWIKADRTICKVNGFRGFRTYITRPSIEPAPINPPCEMSVHTGEARIEIDSMTCERDASFDAGSVTKLFFANRSQ